MNRFKKSRLFFLIWIISVIAGCASLPGGEVITVKDRKIEYVFQRKNGPSVIFENGLGGTFDWWSKVYPEISQNQTVLAYNRPGYGKSQSVSSPRDGEEVVEELHQLLKKLEIPPPYVLVGHSLGGLYFQYFARRYPDEVKALLLVDSTHPRQMSGAGAVERWPGWVQFFFKLLTPKAGLEELSQIEKTGQQVMALPALNSDKIKTVIMLASEPENPSSELEMHAVLMRQDFYQLYPNSRFITVKGNHAIPLNSPQEVIQQIKDLSR